MTDVGNSSPFEGDLEAALRASRDSEDRLRFALDAGQVGTWDWDIEKNVVHWSERVYAFHGVEPGKFGGRLEDFEKCVHPADRERVRAAIAETLRTGKRYEVEFRAVHPDGTVCWLSTIGRVVYGMEGKPVRMVGAMEDVTDRHLGEEERERLLAREKAARAEAEAANRAKDRFIAVLSHELRTPLSPVLAATASLQHDPRLPDDVREDLNLIRRNLELQARLIDDMLDLTRVGRGKLHLNLETVDLHTAIGEALEICRAEANAKGLVMATELGAQTFCVHGDSARLQQILWNLIRNAIKFTPAGGKVTVKSWNIGEEKVGVSVADTGVGIEAGVLPKIFDAWEQGETGERLGGLGLGLAISRALVDLHHGELRAESEGKGKGARFTLILPVMVGVSETDCEGRVAGNVVDAAALEAPVERLRILLVEDHEDTARVIGKLLRREGYRVVVAHSVAGALEKAGQGTFDLMISDIGLPDGSGLELMQKMKWQGITRGIAMTGYGMEEDVRKSREAGYSAHLTKPVDFRALEAMIRKVGAERE